MTRLRLVLFSSYSLLRVVVEQMLVLLAICIDLGEEVLSSLPGILGSYSLAVGCCSCGGFRLVSALLL